MKKFLAVLAALVVLVAAFTGCGQLSNPAGSTGRPIDGGSKRPEKPSEQAFSVTLSLNGQLYIPGDGVKAQWYDGASFRQADFNSEGLAAIEGLNGDYTVTVLGLDDKYAYNPNFNYVTNDSRDIDIPIYELNDLKGEGKLYDEYEIYSPGFYRAEFKSDEEAKNGVYFIYAPKEVGVYTIESYNDITANDVNPILDAYEGTKAFCNMSSRKIVDEGGRASASYTKNFRFSVSIRSTMHVYRFAVRFDSKGKVNYPFYVNFKVDYGGTVEPIVVPKGVPVNYTEDFEARKTQLADMGISWNGTGWQYAHTNMRIGGVVYRYLVGDDFQYNPDDGLWHVWDYEANDYGAIVWAKINKDNMVLQTDSGSGFLDGMIRLNYLNGHDYSAFASAYANHTNSDGCYPVTQELKEFLQQFATQQRYFMDGDGWAESLNYVSLEDDQWLFACGYYA